ncbi:MAG: hypothetical protein JAY84_00810 [Candidatus Thiodiazotropha taylori]|nr:hypothetical protein [Candidatus Thiodiazotropha taylori]
MKRIIVGICALSLSGCVTVGSKPPSKQTEGEVESGYTYIPIDPFAVDTVESDSCKEHGFKPKPEDLLASLPDNAVRMLVEKIDTSGSVTYGTSKLGAKGESYIITVDFINADTINVPVWVSRTVRKADGDEINIPILAQLDDKLKILPNSERFQVHRIDRESNEKEPTGDFEEFNIPVYVGIGLRVSANVNVVGANANISGIGIIGAEASSENLTGSLVVQTLGVNGKSISAALPIHSELNRTTAQNAIVSVGSIKALLYENETVVYPRVVGLYLPFPGGKPLVNALISELSRKRVEWPRPCVVKGG